MSKYRVETYTHPFAGQVDSIFQDLEDGSYLSIPADPANSDYQRYLKWLEDPTATDQPIGGNI